MSYDFDKPFDLSVYVDFHVPNDTKPVIVDYNLKKINKTLFGEEFDFKRHHISSDDYGGEIVYEYRIPILVSMKNVRDFFEKLRVLYDITEDLTPHFTQNTFEALSRRKIIYQTETLKRINNNFS